MEEFEFETGLLLIYLRFIERCRMLEALRSLVFVIDFEREDGARISGAVEQAMEVRL